MESCAAAKSIVLLHSETLSGFNSIYGYAENSAYTYVRRQGTLAGHGKTNINGYSKKKKNRAKLDIRCKFFTETWKSFKKAIRYGLLPVTLHRNIFQRLQGLSKRCL